MASLSVPFSPSSSDRRSCGVAAVGGDAGQSFAAREIKELAQESDRSATIKFEPAHQVPASAQNAPIVSDSRFVAVSPVIAPPAPVSRATTCWCNSAPTSAATLGIGNAATTVPAFGT